MRVIGFNEKIIVASDDFGKIYLCDVELYTTDGEAQWDLIKPSREVYEKRQAIAQVEGKYEPKSENEF